MQVKKLQLELNMGQQTCYRWERSMSGCILSPCLFNFYAENIIRNAGLDEAQAGIKIAGRNTLMAKSEEELKSLLTKVKEESEKAVLNLNIQNTKIMASSPITSWQIDEEITETETLFFGLQNHCRC